MIIHFNPHKHNYIQLKDKKILILKDQKDKFKAISVVCPHKGGPLHLGKWCKEKKAVFCPWHKNPTPFKTLCRKAFPLITSGETGKLILSDIKEEFVSLGNIETFREFTFEEKAP